MNHNPHPVKPSPLEPGSTIAVISPAGPIAKKRLRAGVRQLQDWGYTVKLSESTRGRHGDFSAPDSVRLNDLVNTFSDPDVKAVFCSRGGYGSGRLLADIPYELIAENPKIFIGFSDTTVLNWTLFSQTGLITFSGPTVGEIGEGLPDGAKKSLFSAIVRSETDGRLCGEALSPLRSGSVTGPLFPGCLSLIVTLLGTPYLPDLTGAILVIEEINEKPYRVDRMLTHLKNAGVLDRISALLVGRMVNCWPASSRGKHLPLAEILLDLTSSNPIPIYVGLSYGHLRDRLTVPVGTQVEISETDGLRLLESPLLDASIL